jgi:hypothetical protein
MRFFISRSALVVPLVLPLALVALSACSTKPAVSTATVAPHETRESRPYQRAQDRSYYDLLTDLRQRIDRIDRRLDVVQEDLGAIQQRTVANADEDRTAGKAYGHVVDKRTAAEQQQARAIEQDRVARESLAPTSLVPDKIKQPAKAAPKPQPKAVVKETVVKTVQAKAAPAKAAAPAAASGGKLAVTGVRISEDTSRTRLVFDTTGAVKISSDLDNSEKLLIITLPKTAWSAATQKSFKDLKLISAYEVANGTGADTQVILTLKGPVTLGNSETLPPDAGHGYRTYIDLK